MKSLKKSSEIDILMWLSLFLNDKVFIESLLINEWKCESITWDWVEYTIRFDSDLNSIWTDFVGLHYLKLSYPEIAYLFKIEKISLNINHEWFFDYIKDVDWGELIDKVIWDDETMYRAVLWDLYLREYDVDAVVSMIEDVKNQIFNLNLKRVYVES